MDFKDFFTLTKGSTIGYFREIDVWFDKDTNLRKYKPQNGGWSINEILEHIMLTNQSFLILINKGKIKSLKKETLVDKSPIRYEDTHIESLFEVGTHKSFVLERPEHMKPTGKTNLSDVRSTLKKQMDECLETLDSLKNGEGDLAKMSANILGKIDVYENIYFLFLHTKRHIEQMEEVEAEFSEINN